MDPLNPTNIGSEQEWRDTLAHDPRFDDSLLREYDFDAALCMEQMRAVSERRIDAHTAVIDDEVRPVEDIAEAAYDQSVAQRTAYEAGARALSAGEVAVLVLNGGLATRFGGVVKGAVEVFDDQSFLGIKISDVVRARDLFSADIPLLVMNSFATGRDTTAHLQSHDYYGMRPEEVRTFNQSISIRLEESGDPFIGSDGLGKYYAPGHGEFFQRIHACGLYETLVRQGIRYLTFSNIDNLGASIDPWLIGNHVLSGCDMTIEVVRKTRNALGQWDVGGAPALVRNRVQVIEGFRFPATLAPDALHDFQTNNMYFSMAALAAPPSLPRYLVSKQLEGRRSVSFEAVTCEATGVLRPDGTPWLSLNLIRVPRQGPRGRFFPVKSREDLGSLRPEIRNRVQDGWSLREKDARA